MNSALTSLLTALSTAALFAALSKRRRGAARGSYRAPQQECDRLSVSAAKYRVLKVKPLRQRVLTILDCPDTYWMRN